MSQRVASRPGSARSGGFTLIELLAVIAILAALLAVLLPALRSARGAANTVVCSANMKTVTMEFRLFAEGTSERGQGDSRKLGGSRFWINDFQDSLYGLDEFWDRDDANVAVLDTADEIMLCPSGSRTLNKRRGRPCGREAIFPLPEVSTALNMRLYRGSIDVKGKRLLASPVATNVSERVLDHPYVPLVLDVDAEAAINKGVDPFYIAPPVRGLDDPYASARYWSPSLRHGGKAVVGFVGGQVLSSFAPQDENWDWKYQAEVGR